MAKKSKVVKKALVKKVAPKKVAPKKAAAKKTVSKPVASKSSKGPVKKAAPQKAVLKKDAPKKPIVKKAIAKKAAPKKVVVVKKVVAKPVIKAAAKKKAAQTPQPKPGASIPVMAAVSDELVEKAVNSADNKPMMEPEGDLPTPTPDPIQAFDKNTFNKATTKGDPHSKLHLSKSKGGIKPSGKKPLW